ncbi:hypothetical protein [Amycolatopsis japonica]
MTELHAWKASDEFAAALRKRLAERKAYFADVVTPFINAHPKQPPYGTHGDATSFDFRIDGFADGDRKSPPPEGLSRAQARDWLKPVRGAAGEPWREALKNLNGIPSVDKVFHDFKIPVFVLSLHRLCRANVRDLEVGVYLTASVDLTEGKDCDHLTPVKLSEFYAAVEAEPSAA